jgi:xylan 1,4-beta-xylosidase
MGSPKQLSALQVEHLNELTRDLPELDKVVESGASGTFDLTLPMHSNDIVLLELIKSNNLK